MSIFEAEVIPGLEPCAIDELRYRYGADISEISPTRAGFLRFKFRGEPQSLCQLRSVIAIYQVHAFPIPRPRALLGHRHFGRLQYILNNIPGTFEQRPQTLGIGAAGSESSVMRRLRRELSHALKLEAAADGKGELFIRIIPARPAKGWEVLARISPQPLSARAYRAANMPGSLNAAVAFAMTQVAPMPDAATVVNLCSGASTIAIEHALLYPWHRVLAVDCSADALEAGGRNTSASGTDDSVQQVQADAGCAPLPAALADRLYADLPFGRHVGSHEGNRRLYPAVLREAARLARADALFVVLTHEVKLIRRCLRQTSWTIENETRINLRGLHPRLFVLKRNSNRI